MLASNTTDPSSAEGVGHEVFTPWYVRTSPAKILGHISYFKLQVQRFKGSSGGYHNMHRSSVSIQLEASCLAFKRSRLYTTRYATFRIVLRRYLIQLLLTDGPEPVNCASLSTASRNRGTIRQGNVSG
jgi:hypothetical protein